MGFQLHPQFPYLYSIQSYHRLFPCPIASFSKSSCSHVEYSEIIIVYQSFGFLGAILGRDQISPLHHALKETESKAFTSSFLPFISSSPSEADAQNGVHQSFANESNTENQPKEGMSPPLTMVLQLSCVRNTRHGQRAGDKQAEWVPPLSPSQF